MSINIESLQAKLLVLAKEQKIDFQVILNRFGTEQFLARLSQSSNAEQFIFKGGSLLMYMIETDRKTRDIDFSIKNLSHKTNDLLEIIKNIFDIQLDDGIVLVKSEGELLKHPDMEESGVRVMCHFQLGKMRGQVQMDLAFGDIFEPVRIVLEKMRYKGVCLVGENFSILAYPPESIFAEKLHVVVSKKELNTRMKDYYDLWKLCSKLADLKKLKNSINSTFKNRHKKPTSKISFNEIQIEILQTRWINFLKKEKLQSAPNQISQVIKVINNLCSANKKPSD